MAAVLPFFVMTRPFTARTPVRVVADLNWFGHIPMYHRLFLQAFLDLGERVISLTPAPDEVAVTPELASALTDGRLHLQRLPSGNTQPPARRWGGLLGGAPALTPFWQAVRQNMRIRQWRARRRWHSLVTEVARLVPAPAIQLYVPYLNDLLHARPATTPSRVRWSGLYLNSSELRTALSPLQASQLQLLRHHNVSCVNVLDEGSVEVLHTTIAKPVVVVPDVTDVTVPAEPDELSRNILRRAGGRPIVALLGHLTPRKGLARFCRLAAAGADSGLFFLVAGQLEELQVHPSDVTYLRAAAEQRSPHVHAYLERVPTEANFNQLVRLAGLIYARYDGFLASSNLLTKAAAFGKPVVVSSVGCMAERVNRYGIGFTSDRDDAAELMLLGAVGRGLLACRAGAYAAYSSDHSYERLVTQLATTRDVERHPSQPL